MVALSELTFGADGRRLVIEGGEEARVEIPGGGDLLKA